MNKFTSLDNINFSAEWAKDFTITLGPAMMRTEYKDALDDLSSKASAAFEKIFNNEDSSNSLNQENVILNSVSSPAPTNAMSPFQSSEEDEEVFVEGKDDPMLVDMQPHGLLSES